MNDDLAESIGLSGFAVQGDGIGGMLKTRVSDFRVEEETKTLNLDPKGRFTVAKVTLTNWETNRFVNRLAKQLRMSRDRIWFAGTKDKRAITKQLFVIDSQVAKVAAVEIADVEIEILGRSHQKLGFGSHRGNRFTIIVRGCCDQNGEPLSDDKAIEQVESILKGMAAKLGLGIFPNWIGPQRFGANRPVTPMVGRLLLQNDVEAAVMAYLGMQGVGESDEVAAFRGAIRDGKPKAETLEICPRHLGFEADMLRHLVEREDDWIGAFLKLPRNLQLMMIHAIQSEAFNRNIIARIESGLPLTTPVPGDVVCPIDDRGSVELDRSVMVTDRVLDRLSRNCELGRLRVTGFLPGTQHQACTGEAGRIEQEVLARMGLDEIDWQVRSVRRLTSKGTRRALVTWFKEFSVESVPLATAESLSERWQQGPQEGDRWHPEGACLRFRFQLPPGAYATTFLREFMRAPIHQL